MSSMRWAVSIALVMVIAVMVRLNDATAVAASAAVQEDPAGEARRKTFDEFLDLYVRDGYVYYRALKSERSRFDAYVNSLAEVQVGWLSRDEQLAFWLHAYNSLVLRTASTTIPFKAIRPSTRPRASGRSPARSSV